MSSKETLFGGTGSNDAELEPKQPATDEQIKYLFNLAAGKSGYHSDYESAYSKDYVQFFVGYLYKDDLTGTIFETKGINRISFDYCKACKYSEHLPNDKIHNVIRPRLEIILFGPEETSGNEKILAKYFTIFDKGRKTKSASRYSILTQYLVEEADGIPHKKDSIDDGLTQQETEQLLSLRYKIR
jgi:hypothetical protein